MKNFLFILTLTLCFPAGTVLADDNVQVKQQIAAACRLLPTYVPSPDVDYKPGVDVHGHYVAPADVEGSVQPALPKTYNIPLTVSLVKALNLDATQYPVSALGTGTEIPLGTLNVDGNNVSLNGKPLSNDQQGKLAALCKN